jgi:hypothetical protein
LRAARWMIEHHPGDWVRTVYEVDAVHQIDWAMYEVQKAAIDDGKNIDWHPPMDEQPQRTGRLREALEYLQRAHANVVQEEDNFFAQGLRNRAIGGIDAAIMAVSRALID